MIRVRNDDVLMHWNWKKTIGHKNIVDPVSTLRNIHNMILTYPKQLIHVPAILCRNVQEFPEAIPFIRQEAEAGRMLPEIHGWDHIDYANFTYDGMCFDLKRCIQFMETKLGVKASKFYTPWGANTETIQRAANSLGLEVVDCSNILYQKNLPKGVDNVEVFMHWWEGPENMLEMFETLGEPI
jgi:hypothetical protein